jgi:hypothetical protein
LERVALVEIRAMELSVAIPFSRPSHHLAVAEEARLIPLVVTEVAVVVVVDSIRELLLQVGLEQEAKAVMVHLHTMLACLASEVVVAALQPMVLLQQQVSRQMAAPDCLRR